MSGFLASNSYSVVTENEISVILNHFNTDYIFDVIKDNIQRRFENYQLDNPNIVASYEQYFKQLMLQYDSTDYCQQIQYTRNETYKQIISILCNEYQLQFNDDEIQDYYSIAFHLYDLLVSNFGNKLITFFCNFILKERNYLYSSLQLADFKKNKDTSTIYNKKVFKNSKVAIINSNLDYVIDNICCYDIPFEAVLSLIYQDKNMVKFIETTIFPMNDFFKAAYVPVICSNLKPIILTNIRLEMQRSLDNDDINIYKEEGDF